MIDTFYCICVCRDVLISTGKGVKAPWLLKTVFRGAYISARKMKTHIPKHLVNEQLYTSESQHDIINGAKKGVTDTEYRQDVDYAASCRSCGLGRFS